MELFTIGNKMMYLLISLNNDYKFKFSIEPTLLLVNRNLQQNLELQDFDIDVHNEVHTTVYKIIISQKFTTTVLIKYI